VFVLREGRCLEREREVKWSSVLLLLVAGHTLHEVFVLREGRFARIPDIVVWPCKLTSSDFSILIYLFIYLYISGPFGLLQVAYDDI